MSGKCTKDHRYESLFASLPEDQGGAGRHKCAGCAYELGLAAGRRREERFDIDLASLPESQAGTVRHRSPHAAFALGYLEGVRQSYGASSS